MKKRIPLIKISNRKPRIRKLLPQKLAVVELKNPKLQLSPKEK
jgi:hypothetical protein